MTPRRGAILGIISLKKVGNHCIIVFAYFSHMYFSDAELYGVCFAGESTVDVVNIESSAAEIAVRMCDVESGT